MLVHKVEQNLFVSGDVQPRVSPEVINEPSLLNLIIADPSTLFMMVILNLLEE